MKKIIALGLALGLSFATLTGCNSAKETEDATKETENATTQQEEQAENTNTETATEGAEVTYTDGTYTAEGEEDERGWKPMISIEVKDGKIASVDYEEVNEAEGTTKQDNEEYNNMMKEKNGIGPADFFPQLESALVETQDPEAVDIISGATHGSEDFKEVAKKALASASSEAQTEVTYKDGTYEAEGEPDERGWKPMITIEVKDGKIASVDYEEVNEEEGTTKQNNEEYNNMMKEKNGIGPADFFPQLESALVETQDPEAVDIISGATHGSEDFKEVAKKALDSAK